MPPQGGRFCGGSIFDNPAVCEKHKHSPPDKSLTESATLPFSQAPAYLKFNPFITSGYRRGGSDLRGCLKSALTWTNETTNIWTHVGGFLVFFYLSLQQVLNFNSEVDNGEAFLVKLGVLVCFQACMLLSASYHTFCCSSDASYRKWLTADLIGVSFALLAIYLSGIYFAFKCDEFWLRVHLLTILGMFLVALLAQCGGGDHSPEEGFHWRLLLFGAWAAYGVLPTIQWVWMEMEAQAGAQKLDVGWYVVQWDASSGFSEEVKHLLPRIVKMYTLSALAFFFYVSRLPERFYPGRFNYFLSSHNLWHVLIFVALYYWQGVVDEQYSQGTGVASCSPRVVLS